MDTSAKVAQVSILERLFCFIAFQAKLNMLESLHDYLTICVIITSLQHQNNLLICKKVLVSAALKLVEFTIKPQFNLCV
jgi:hypothetical protein